MSVGKYKIFHGKCLMYLENMVQDIYDNMNYTKDHWDYQPLECIKTDLEKLIRDHQFGYLMSDGEMYDIEYTKDFTIKDHWKKLFHETIDSEYLEQLEKENSDYLSHMFKGLKELHREIEPSNTLENYTN